MAKILVVEDEENIRELHKRNLTRNNHEVETVENGLDALDKVREFKPDLILLDIMLPELSGIELLQLLKEQPKYKDIPVLMITGVSGTAEITKCLEIGALGYIIKGSSSDEMNKKIRIILDSMKL